MGEGISGPKKGASNKDTPQNERKKIKIWLEVIFLRINILGEILQILLRDKNTSCKISRALLASIKISGFHFEEFYYRAPSCFGSIYKLASERASAASLKSSQSCAVLRHHKAPQCQVMRYF